ncbi:DNA excision repair protein ERCC-1 [Fimicolochytrium jonesii]|uniref:DNA excision repair protein ERCC-1 n=1 Tax=Fimicolochytrium jonesii TaxID=1396493 RepID=UPI0022FE9839|nr:DNA excision repair protein ERCC-1 [Fimicolochytrium jonesii]KAI8824815.1 DNA excision repair protein ERCC-1 [Fimicolochytrium jonesii]
MAEPPPKKPLFQLPSQSEIEKRQRGLREKVPELRFNAGASGANPRSSSKTIAAGPSHPVTNAPAGPSHPTTRPPAGTTHAAARPPGPSHLGGRPIAPSRTGEVTRAGAARPSEGQQQHLQRPPRPPAQLQPPQGQPAGPPGGGNPAPAALNRTGSNPTKRTKGPNAVVVNSCQRGNGVLNFIKNVPWEYGDIVPDYQVGQTSCALFLSLKYHRLHPEYVYTRIKQMGHNYLLRVLMVLVDIDDHQPSIRDLTRICIYNNMTLMLAWSQEEVGRYLETFKAYEFKPPDLLKERVDSDYLAKLTDALTQIKTVNKTDVLTLASAFGSLRGIISAKPDELAQCPGFGEQKVRRIHEAFQQPFLLSKKSRTG